MRQFLACRFSPEAKITYTYHWDGAPFRPGDQVRVPSGKGEKIVTIAEIADQPPPFATKAILGPKRPEPGKLL